MLLKCVSLIPTYGKFIQNHLPALCNTINCCNDFTQVRYIAKHWDPKWKKLRAAKVIKIKLPSFEKNEEDMDPTELDKEQLRSRMKEYGFMPQKAWSERPAYLSCTPVIFESYIVPEGDGKYSAITKEGAKQKVTFLDNKRKSLLAIRKIKTFDDTFRTSFFIEEAMDIYIKAHEALATKDENKIIEFVTENAYPKMIHNIMDKTIYWKFLESLEPARIVHARYTDLISKENVFAQITVRFHTQQMLAVYDRFGRLIQGSEILKKDVLEYIVFEKHISNKYGTWRIHGKIIPSWMTATSVAESTYVLPKEEADSTKPPPVETTLVEDTPKEAATTQQT